MLIKIAIILSKIVAHVENYSHLYISKQANDKKFNDMTHCNTTSSTKIATSVNELDSLLQLFMRKYFCFFASAPEAMIGEAGFEDYVKFTHPGTKKTVAVKFPVTLQVG